MGFLKNNRSALNKELKDMRARRFFSPAAFYLYESITSAVTRFAKGRLIDLGCGEMPYKFFIEARAQEYHTLDLEARTEGVTYLGSILDMKMVADASYDSALCLDVIEHVLKPSQALKEIGRILKKDGVLILSVPHLSRLHEEPHDYYRYTKYALSALLQENGFKVLEIAPAGSLLTFVGHQLSSFLVCLFWGVPVIKYVVLGLNAILITLPLHYLSKIFLKNTTMPQSYICVAQKI